MDKIELTDFEYRTGEIMGELTPYPGILGFPIELDKTDEDKVFFKFEGDIWKLIGEFDPNGIEFWKRV